MLVNFGTSGKGPKMRTSELESRFYKLDEKHNVVRFEGDLSEWCQWFEDIDNRRVAGTQIGESEVWVSTVFLGMDHAFRGGPPVVFETMIFGGEHDGYQERCSTWNDALRMHNRAVRLARGVGRKRKPDVNEDPT